MKKYQARLHKHTDDNVSISRDYISFEPVDNNMIIQQNSLENDESQYQINHRSKINFNVNPVQELSSNMDEAAVKKMVEE